MSTLIRKSILTIKPYTPGKPIEEVRRELGLRDVIKLASNENPLGPSPKAIAAVAKGLGQVNRYPDATSFYLKRRLARALKVGEDALVIGNGSDESITIAARAFLSPGDEVVIARPTFLIYEIASQLAEAKIRIVPLKGLRYDLEAMQRAVTKRTKMVFIANPDNPTGSYVTRKELEAFLRGLPESVVVFLDEAYFEFGQAFGDYPNGLKYLKRPNLIVARTFSKAYGLCGLRVGYTVSSVENAGYMERVREPFNINVLAQIGATAALDDKGFLKRTLRHTTSEKTFFYRAFERLGLVYQPSATNFVLVDVGRDSTPVFRALLRRGIIVRDMKAWGFPSSLRVTVGTRGEDRRFIRALGEIIRS